MFFSLLVRLRGDDARDNVLEHAVDVGACLGACVEQCKPLFEIIANRTGRRFGISFERE